MWNIWFHSWKYWRFNDSRFDKSYDGSALIEENNIDVLDQFDNAVILFMGAGDIQKLQRAYEEHVGMTNEF